MEEKIKIKEMIEQAEQHQTRFETQETIDMLKKVYRDLEALEFIYNHYEMNGLYELYPVYHNDPNEFKEIRKWWQNEGVVE